ncbi:retinitis pigmentosa 1-like 1 protein isoform X2 [Hyla sarda]|uniref:retinitis pigmentosa 1-like 1 protein isoform X2 n=1 Tax=Hyla sarda TaxID=327740 RepID=UPI0024C38B2A|nr:retinitis pigmentosa 1-like 1 protein isoform X2 [Hyla sarda]
MAILAPSFGLKAKKSVIHPRSASSNRTRPSLSSEKSYPNGLSMSPVNSGFGSYPNMSPHGKSEDPGHSLLNDDIEKKVHVNKDGSLSVEMKVRFRLLNEETLQWSTQIKKSSTKCEQLCLFDENDKMEEMNTENFTETDESFYPCDADSCSSKLNEAGIEDMYCSHCGMQCQDYDIWKNPMHVNQQEDYAKRATWQTRSSASSASSHHRVMCDQKTSIDSLHSVSSEEYTEHIVHRSSHYSETKENGDAIVTYSTVSRSESRSGRSTVVSNVDAISDTEQSKKSKSRNKSCSSLKSHNSVKKQQSQLSEQHSHRSLGGSFDECPEASPTPCSDGENCSQRVSVVSQSSVHSKKSQSGMLKRNSTNTKSFSSNISYHEVEEEEMHQSSCKESLKNTQGMSTETGNSEDPCGSEPAEDTNNSNDNETHDQNTENASCTDPIKCSLDCDKHFTRGSSRASTKSRSSSRESGKINGHSEDGTLCKSPGLTKQNSESVMIKQESMDTCENNVSESKATLSQSKRKSFTEHQAQSLQSTRSRQSMSSVTELVQTNCVQDEQQTLNHQESCNESLTSTEKSDHIACTGNEDGELSIAISRASSKSLSSKFNCISCQENEQVFNASSRVSSMSEKKSIAKSSSDKSDHDGAREMSQEEETIDDNKVVADSNCQTAAPDMNCIHSPSPPEGKPTHKQLRLAQFKLSSTSTSSDQMKTLNGEKTGNSRASTPASKKILACKASTETCKKMTNHNSTEDIQSTKKRKNSSSSSKRKHKGESLDGDNNANSQLVPSALPNVTPEEVVNEWLRKIPSQTMVVEYELEESQKKAQTEIGTEANTDICKKQEEGDLHKEPPAADHNGNEAMEEISQDVHCGNTTNNIHDTNTIDEKYSEESVLLSKVAANNVKNEYSCDKKSLPNNIQTSVQIMKALLTPLQESKFDRSNSLPEVSQTMGRKLSNSATVLISCLASLQLLDESQTEITNNGNDLKKPKYNKLLNILQALWTQSPTNKSITNIKSGKRYSRDDELTPVSSSGVDLNSGFGGSGDGSITGGGDHMVATGKPEDGKPFTVAKEVVVSGEHNVANGQENKNEVKSCIMDENMNEKKLDSSDNTFEEEIKEETKEEGHYNSVNNVNDVECLETVEEHRISNNDNINILSHSEEPKSNESNSPETNNINSPSNCQSTVIISTSDSNGNGNNGNKQELDANPVWVLKLLKKIEKEFMTHYVDAMNEFKVRWNLEDNENLDDMIAELKNEVSQRIQRSISNELKRIKTQVGTRTPRPPPQGSRRKSSLQAEERRRRLQTLHRVSIHRYATGGNRDVGTNDFSCETDEEDLTFSASFGDDSIGQPNDDFCPCEKCIKQKRALKLAKPQVVAENAPLIKAFDLQQILKLKRQNDDPKNDVSDGTFLPLLKEQSKEAEQSIAPSFSPDCPAENEEDINDVDVLSKAEEEIEKGKSDILSEDSDISSREVKSAMDEGECCDSSNFQSNTTLQEKETENLQSIGPEEDTKNTYDLEEDLENSHPDVLETNSTIENEMGMECPDGNTSVCEETVNNDECEPLDDQSTSNQEEVNETEENEEKTNETDEGLIATDEFSEDDHLVKNETTIYVMSAGEDVQEEGTETIENNGSNLPKSCLGQCSLITQNGSAEDAETDCKENNVGETSPNGQSNSSGSKKSQMYPDSPSEDEDGDSPRDSPVGLPKNETKGQVYANNIESFEEGDNKSKKGTDEDIIDQEDLDF